jgi:hypothetical protein
MISEKISYHHPLPRVGEHDRTVPKAIEVVAARALRDEETRHAFVAPDRREVKRGIKEQVTSVDIGARVNQQARHAPRRLT